MNMKDDLRGSGRTTRQMIAAPNNAYYVWCNNYLAWARDLARKHRREDLKIMPLSWFQNGYYRGLDTRLIVFDHAIAESE
jgi:hypothetical protein